MFSKEKVNGILIPAMGTLSHKIWERCARHHRLYGRAPFRSELESAMPSTKKSTIATILRNFRMYHNLPDERFGLTYEQKAEKRKKARSKK